MSTAASLFVSLESREEDVFQHEVWYVLPGCPCSVVEGVIESDFYERPRLVTTYLNGLELEDGLVEQLLVAVFESLIGEMLDRDGHEIAWHVPDIRPWLERCLSPEGAAYILARTRGLRVDRGPEWPMTETTIG